MEHFAGRLRIGDPGSVTFDPTARPPIGVRQGTPGVTITHFADLEQFDFAIAIEVAANSGHVTSHYHLAKHEMKYVASGSVLARYWDVADTERNEVVEVMLRSGMTDRIDPGIVHSYHATDEACLMIELAHTVTTDDIYQVDP